MKELRVKQRRARKEVIERRQNRYYKLVKIFSEPSLRKKAIEGFRRQYSKEKEERCSIYNSLAEYIMGEDPIAALALRATSPKK